MTALLEVRDLAVSYRLKGGLLGRLAGRPTPVLDAVLDVSFSIGKAAIFGLLGESGSGKSSLARALVGLTPVRAGSVHFEGAAIDVNREASLQGYRRQVALMFQDPVASLSPRLTVRSLLTEPFAIHGLEHDADAECARLLDLVGLPGDFASRYPHELSGGQARRIGVARALAVDPKLVIADEPTAGLDVSVQGELLNLLNELRRERGVSFIIVTHNLAVARHVCDEAAVMYMGRFVERGPTQTLFDSPEHPYTKALVGSQPIPDPNEPRREPALSGEVPSLLRRPSGCEFHTRCPRLRPPCRTVRPDISRASAGHEFRCHFPLRSPLRQGLAHVE